MHIGSWYEATITHHHCRSLGEPRVAYHQHHLYPYLGASGRHPFPMARKVFTNHRSVTINSIFHTIPCEVFGILVSLILETGDATKTDDFSEKSSKEGDGGVNPQIYDADF